jgi:hypothetical protein
VLDGLDIDDSENKPAEGEEFADDTDDFKENEVEITTAKKNGQPIEVRKMNDVK